jgi:hypothetical protein
LSSSSNNWSKSGKKVSYSQNLYFLVKKGKGKIDDSDEEDALLEEVHKFGKSDIKKINKKLEKQAVDSAQCDILSMMMKKKSPQEEVILSQKEHSQDDEMSLKTQEISQKIVAEAEKAENEKPAKKAKEEPKKLIKPKICYEREDIFKKRVKIKLDDYDIFFPFKPYDVQN